jgi:hypothetical protein
MSLYTDLIEAGVPVSNHYSDLYCPVNETTRTLLKKHAVTATTFTNQVEGGLWYDVPCMYDPFWEMKTVRPT